MMPFRLFLISRVRYTLSLSNMRCFRKCLPGLDRCCPVLPRVRQAGLTRRSGLSLIEQKPASGAWGGGGWCGSRAAQELTWDPGWRREDRVGGECRHGVFWRRVRAGFSILKMSARVLTVLVFHILPWGWRSSRNHRPSWRTLQCGLKDPQSSGYVPC